LEKPEAVLSMRCVDSNLCPDIIVYARSFGVGYYLHAIELELGEMKYRRVRNLNYTETVRFHGHDGPFLAVGYRLGRYLVKKLRPPGIMGLRITVKTRIQKPFTCVLDGLQCSTFATFGKGNLVVKNVSGRKILVCVEKGTKVLKFRMTQKAWDVCHVAVDLEKAARKILRMPINQLWRTIS
jgi:formylmethanofuran dehydrogenase subunit E